MPNLDRRGPRWGVGPGTGRGRGPCGAGFSRSFGFRRPSREQELEWLKEDEKSLQEELALIREEIKELANK